MEQVTKEKILVKVAFTNEVEAFPSDAPEDHAHIIDNRLFPYFYPIRTKKIDVKIWDAVVTLFHKCGHLDIFRRDDQTTQLIFKLKGRELDTSVVLQKKGRSVQIGRNIDDGRYEWFWFMSCKIADDGAWRVVRAASEKRFKREVEVTTEDGTTSTKRRTFIKRIDADTNELRAEFAREMAHFLMRSRCFNAATWKKIVHTRLTDQPRKEGDWLELPWTYE
ncbi:hypothetical protein K491DRAFT_678532 [Lophiostoma macrostomum CBS 122681]|uniref:Uncharacterized protein n=1 Tax=Lophiostoma macrostomum CBS 122681 TaxID=1314788 RepID=A0A6A6T9B1_9PLEO|nr:hypothetical protein K491DRAFT_678532 [Lophiostoma macrostomum CBS 122681]